MKIKYTHHSRWVQSVPHGAEGQFEKRIVTNPRSISSFRKLFLSVWQIFIVYL